MSALERRLAEAVAGSALARRLPTLASSFLERRSGDAAAARLDGGVLVGLARLLASQPLVAAFLSHRPALLERIADSDAGTLAARARALEADAGDDSPKDLETALDGLRLLRREETCLAACLDLGGVSPFEQVSELLSVLAEAIAKRALALARRTVPPESGEAPLSVIGMGKLAGREFTYHSDLDLIFLYAGSAEEAERPSRIAQRLISYLTTMTGAGVAYAVDTRLRPSGQQGALVTSLDGFERYQSEEAEIWEHLALLRARPIAGEVARAGELLARVRGRVLARSTSPWSYLAAMRRRVEAERGREPRDAIAFKVGSGGLMDVDFLAGGGLLERGAAPFPSLPSLAAMLCAALRGERIEAFLDDYRFLRLVEARARWCAGRAVEELEAGEEARAVVAELVQPGLAPPALVQKVDATRRRVRAAYEAVIGAGTIRALA